MFTTPIISALPKNTNILNYKSVNQLSVSNEYIGTTYPSNNEYGEKTRYLNNIDIRDDSKYSTVFTSKYRNRNGFIILKSTQNSAMLTLSRYRT